MFYCQLRFPPWNLLTFIEFCEVPLDVCRAVTVCGQWLSVNGAHLMSHPCVTLENEPRIAVREQLLPTSKRSLGQGNIFTGICLSTGRGSLSRRVSVKGSPFNGLCLGGLCPGDLYPGGSVSRGSLSGGLCPPEQRPPCMVKSRQYASYWNAFLLL